MKPLVRSSLIQPGRVALGVSVPHLRAPYAFETALSHPRRPTIGLRASGMSMATRSTGRPQSFREDDSSSLGSGWEPFGRSSDINLCVEALVRRLCGNETPTMG